MIIFMGLLILLKVNIFLVSLDDNKLEQFHISNTA